MGILINLLVAFCSGIFWLIKKFFPFIIKKYGLGAVKFAIQKSITAFLVLTTVAFYASVIVFISNTFTVFRNFIAILQNPSSSSFMSGASSEYLSCFLYLLNASGIASGFNAAFSFGISVLIFMFMHKLYQVSVRTLKLISDEISKSLRLV